MSTLFSETADSIGVKVRQRSEKLVGLKFLYRVRSNSDESAEIVETLQEFSTLPANDPTSADPWFCWKVFRWKNATDWELDRFRVYDGQNLYSFDKVDPLAPENFSRNGYLKPSEGRVEKYADPIVPMMQCRMAEFVFMELIGYGKTRIDAVVNETSPSPWKIIDSPSPDKFILERPIAGSCANTEYYIRVHVSMKPEPIVMRLESDLFGDFSEVLELASFDGILYPSKGREFKYPSADRIEHEKSYEYEVESVSRISERERATWIPDWPPGTQIYGNGNRFIAHTRETQLRDTLSRLALARKDVSVSRRLRFWGGICTIGILISLPLFRFSAKRNSLKHGWTVKHTSGSLGAGEKNELE